MSTPHKLLWPDCRRVFAGECTLRAKCLCLPQIHVETLTPPKVIVLVPGAFGRCLGCEKGALKKGISV